MELTRGTILKNLHRPLYDVYLVYLYSEGSNAHCIKMITTRYGYEIDWDCKMYKPNLMRDRKLYPIVGYIDPDELIKNAILSEVEKGDNIEKSNSLYSQD